MTELITDATVDTESSIVEATGPVIVSVTGVLVNGMVIITADIGAGEAVAFTYAPGDNISICRLEFATGVSFKAKLVGTSSSDTNVTVAYINV